MSMFSIYFFKKRRIVSIILLILNEHMSINAQNDK